MRPHASGTSRSIDVPARGHYTLDLQAYAAGGETHQRMSVPKVSSCCHCCVKRVNPDTTTIAMTGAPNLYGLCD
jgi:hypothetical protein